MARNTTLSTVRRSIVIVISMSMEEEQNQNPTPEAQPQQPQPASEPVAPPAQEQPVSSPQPAAQPPAQSAPQPQPAEQKPEPASQPQPVEQPKPEPAEQPQPEQPAEQPKPEAQPAPASQPVESTEPAKQDDPHAKGRIVRLVAAFIIITILAASGIVFRDQIKSLFSSAVDESQALTIAYAEGFTSIDPTNYEVRNRQYLGNIFDGLTRFDKNLDIESALAISWGQVSDDVWEFKLRENVYFHDGNILDAEDVVNSIEYALDGDESQLQSLLSTVIAVEAVDDLTVEITTDGMDPILPNRLAHVYIFPSEAADYENLLVGTGPYYALSYQTVDSGAVAQEFNLKKFDYYWGFAAKYDEVKLVAIPEKDDREDALLNGEVDVLVNVAPESVTVLEEAGFTVVSQAGLETGFLLFNTEVFEEKSLREAFWMAIDRDAFVESLEGYAKRADQFVSSGVNGYDSSISIPEYDPEGAEEVFAEYGIENFEVYMTYDMAALGSFLEDEFLVIGIDADIVYLTSEELADDIGDLGIYYMGWKSDLGDSADLFETIFASDGAYNPGYSNEVVDGLIEEAANESDEMTRIGVLKDIMGALIEDVSGVPLFEAKVIYGFAEGIEWSPRVDGYVWAGEVD